MSTVIVGGSRRWGGEIDAEGHRTWSVVYQTQGSVRDGPANHVQTPGLPVYGSVWAIDDDLDIWAWCRSGPTSIIPRTDKGVNEFFDISFTFSTRPPGDGGTGSNPSGAKDDKGARKKCSDARIEDPLSEPPSMSGGGMRESKEAMWDYLSRPIRYTSFERIKGAPVEFDFHRDQIVIEQNVVNLEYGLVRSKMDKLNDVPLWDLPIRCWKLCDWTWQRKLYGTCGFYFTRKLTFESNALQVPTTVYNDWVTNVMPMKDYVILYAGKYWLPGWDHYILDESNKVLNGHWNKDTGAWVLDNVGGVAPNYTKPHHYKMAHDRASNPIRVILSYANRGQPALTENDANYIRVQKHDTTNLLELNIPLS